MSGSVTSPSNTPAYQVYNALIPKEGPSGQTYNLPFNLSPGPFEIDLQQTIAQRRMTIVQSVFVDNSANGYPLTLAVAVSGQSIVLPPYSQGYIPILAPNPAVMTVSTAGNVPTRIILLNVPVPAAIWQAGVGAVAANVSVTGGNITTTPASETTTLAGSVTVTTAGSVMQTSAGSVTQTTAGSVSTLLQTAIAGVDRGGTIAAAGVSQAAAAANAARQLMTIQNPPDAASQGIATAENLYVQINAAANVNGANYACLLPGGSLTLCTDVIAETQAVNVNAATIGHRFYAREYS